MGIGEKIVAGAVEKFGNPEDLIRSIVVGFKDLVGKYNVDPKTGVGTGGYTKGRGIYIAWQDGPRGTGEDRVEPNGATLEDVILAVRHRLEFLNKAGKGRMECEENRIALANLQNCLKAMNDRTRNRVTREVEGTHNP